MRASGKLFKLHLPAEKELSRKQQEYCKKFLIAESESDGCDADMTILSAPTPVKEFSRINKTWQIAKCSKLELEFTVTHNPGKNPKHVDF